MGVLWITPRFLINLSSFFVFFLGVIFSLSRIVGYDAFLTEKIIFFLVSFFLFFLCFCFFLLRLVCLSKKYVFYFLFSSLFSLFFLFFNFRSEYLSSTLFFLNILFLIFVSIFAKNNLLKEDTSRFFVLWFWFYVLISLVFYFSGSDFFFEQGNRFVSFWVSPTTFTIWFLSIYILAYSDFFRKKEKRSIGVVAGWIFLTFIVFLSGTRVNLMFSLFLGIVVFFKPLFRSKFIRIFVSIAFVFFVTFAYQIFYFIIEAMGFDMLSYRFEGVDGLDDSFLSRIFYFNQILDEILSSDTLSFLFGHGSDASRVYFIKTIGIDIYPHNDIIRLIYEYGVLFSLMFLVFVIFLASGGVVSFLLVCLYIISFMHNMIFSHYLIMLVIFFGFLDRENNLVRKYV